MKTNFLKIAAVLILALLLNSCATMFSGTTQQVAVNSSPAGASVYVNGEDVNKTTPCQIEIKRKIEASNENGKNQYNFVIKKEGFSDYEHATKAKINGTTWLNLLIGGVYGLAIDYYTGSIWRYDKEINANLSVGDGTSNESNNTIEIVTVKKNRVAVFDPVDDAKTDMVEMIREILSTGITNSGSFKPVERAMIEQVLQENQYQSEGQVDASQVSELGKQMGADYVCVSVIKKTGKNYFITAKLVSVETATVELQQYVKTENGKEDLFEKVEELSEKLFNK